MAFFCKSECLLSVSGRSFCVVLSFFCTTSISNAQTDTPKRETGCVKKESETLKTMRSLKSQNENDALVLFDKICEKDICKVRAKLANSKEIAAFTLDPKKCFSIGEEVKTVDIEERDRIPGCANHYILRYQYVRLSDEEWTSSTLIFETAQVAESDGRLCSQPDFNDGPALATFVSTYKITPQANVYVYELDGYRRFQESMFAKRKYTPEPKR